MLRLLYPPKVVEALVYNAIAPDGHPDEAKRLAQLLDLTAVGEDEDEQDAATAAVNAVVDFSSSAPTTITAQDLSNGEDASAGSSDTQASGSPNKTNTNIRTVNARNLPPLPPHNYPTSSAAAAGAAPGQTRRFSPVQHSPFAALSAANPHPFSPPPPPAVATAPGGGTGPTTGASSERTSTDSLEDRGDAPFARPTSRRLSSPSHMAAAVLRQASLQSRPSLMNNEDVTNVSPANSEVEGYEDLLSEDATARAMKRPSYQLGRAHSYESMDSANNSDGGHIAADRNNSGDTSSPRAAVILVHQRPEVSEEQQQQQLLTAANLLGEEEGDEEQEPEKLSPRVAVIFPVAYRNNEFHNNLHQEIRPGGGGGGGNRYENGSNPSNLHVQQQQPQQQHPHRTFQEHQTAYSNDQRNQQHPHQQQDQQSQQHTHSLSTISEGGGSQAEPMTSRSLSSQLNSFPSNTSPSPQNSTPASSLHWDQEWDLAFCDPRVEQKFSKHINTKALAVEIFFGGALLAAAAAYFIRYPKFSFSKLIDIDGTMQSSGGVLPFLVLFTVPLVAAVNARDSWIQNRCWLVPAMRLLAAITSGPWLVSLGFSPMQAVPLAVVALSNPLVLRFHIPLQLLCMWVAIQPGLRQFLIAFLIPTAVLYVAEQRVRRKFKLESQAAAAVAAVASSAVAGGGGRGSGSAGSGGGVVSPGPVPALGPILGPITTQIG
jgi:hypothetical protein